MNQVMPRDTVEMIVAHRDKAMELYQDAFTALETAQTALDDAKAAWKRAAPSAGGEYYAGDIDEIRIFINSLELPKRDRYVRVAKKVIDATVWQHIIKQTELQRLMDKQAKDELREQMAYVPDKTDRDGQLINEDEINKGLPPVTVENVVATIEDFVLNSETIFRRGLANSFAKLDRRFRSHNGFRFGDRVILDRAFDDWGSWSSYRHTQDVISDIERAFQILDGQEAMSNYNGICWQVDQERRGGGLNPRQSEHVGEFFKIKIYKNGNAHLWFTNKDLLKKANKVLAEWYGEVVGDAEVQEDDPLKSTKMTVAKNFGFFPTPQGALNKLMQGAHYLGGKENPRIRILEPSAGSGNISRRCANAYEAIKDQWSNPEENLKNRYRWDNMVDCIEIQPELAHKLEAEGIYNKVICADFNQVEPNPIYDVVVMNPPFDRERDIDHVCHAMRFLKPGGQLNAIMSAGTEFRQTRKSKAFRGMMERFGAKWEDLPANSFSEVGTNVNTIILRVYRPDNK